MTTAADIVNDAALAAGIGDQYNALDPTSAGVALRTLNRLLDEWSNESLTVFNQAQDSFVMTPGQSAYSTNLLLARPIQIQHIFVRQSNVDYTVTMIGAEDYARIAFKTSAGLPDRCFYNSGMPDGTLNFFPTPSTPYQCFVGYQAQFANLASLQVAVSLPPGYETALVYGLATMLCPLFGTEPTPTCIYHAKSSKSNIKAPNYSLDEASLGLPINRGVFNIFSGE